MKNKKVPNFKHLLITKLFHRQEQSKNRYFKLGLIIVVSGIFSWFIFRQLSLWQVSRAINSQISPITSFDPLELKNELQKQSQSLLLVDIRSRTDYNRGHLKTAINLPWKKKLDSWWNQLNQQKINNKTIVLYEYSAASTSPQELAVYLRKQGLAAYYLSIGYNEWRHFHTFWMPDKEWGTWEVDRFIEE